MVYAWTCEGDLDPDKTTSNMMSLEWPPGSGQQMKFPEVDRCAWFNPAEARVKLNPAQTELIDRLEAILTRSS